MTATAVTLHPDLFGGETPILTPEMLRPVVVRLIWHPEYRARVNGVALYPEQSQRVEAIELYTEGSGIYAELVTWRPRQALQLGRSLYPLLGYQEHRRNLIGHTCDALMTAATAVELLTMLQGRVGTWDGWSDTPITRRWCEGQAITLADLTAALESVA